MKRVFLCSFLLYFLNGGAQDKGFYLDYQTAKCTTEISYDNGIQYPHNDNAYITDTFSVENSVNIYPVYTYNDETKSNYERINVFGDDVERYFELLNKKQITLTELQDLISSRLEVLKMDILINSYVDKKRQK